MKYIKYCLILLSIASTFSCKKLVDQFPQSNLSSATFYSNLSEINQALAGVYNNLQRPMTDEWRLTELRSDNSILGSPGSTASTNRDLSDLDMFIPSTSQQSIFNYWLASYNNIRSVNLILNSLNVNYSESTNALSLDSIQINITAPDRRLTAAEACFVRAYHYFNLVRLYGGVYLISEPITPEEALNMNRTSVANIYKLIETDLQFAAANGINAKFAAITGTNIGRANSWAAKALLAKVYLTQNKKPEAIALLNDIIINSGFALETTYANLFSIANEMNKEILFTIRYKAGGVGLGSPFANAFAPLGSGNSVVNGNGAGQNTPTKDLDAALIATDARKAINIGTYGSGSSATLYCKKYLNPVITAGDAESDWPVLRYADVLLMLAEAQGNNAASLALINQVRVRAGVAALTASAVSTTAQFEAALSNERRLEFAFENQRWFDLLRFNTTLTTITVEQTMKDHFAAIYVGHYNQYIPPFLTLTELQGKVITPRMLLPIPQREIDTNTRLVIPQNPSY